MRGSRTRSGARRRTPGRGPESDREANKRAARRCSMTRRATRPALSRCPGDKIADELSRAKRFSPLTTVHRVGTYPGANAGPDRRRERPQNRAARQRRCLVVVIAQCIETVLSLRTTRCRTLRAPRRCRRGASPDSLPPACVTERVVARDRDHAGAQAAERLRARCKRLGVEVLVIASRCSDVNDALRPPVDPTARPGSSLAPSRSSRTRSAAHGRSRTVGDGTVGAPRGRDSLRSDAPAQISDTRRGGRAWRENRTKHREGTPVPHTPGRVHHGHRV